MSGAKAERYAAYRDSGAAWMGEIPENWKFVRVKDLISKITSGVTPRGGAESYVDVGIPFLRSQNVHNDGLRLDEVSFITQSTHQEMSNSQVKPGDIVFNITGASIARTCVVPDVIKTANISQHIALLRPRKLNETKFISYYLQSQLVKDYVYLTQSGASKEAFNHGQMKCIPVSLPARHEQTAIAAYLDTKTTQIDRKIDLLDQKATQYVKLKQSLINETVTRGLDKSLPVKDSGVTWIGDVPENWEVKRFKDVATQSKEKNGDNPIGEMLSVSGYRGIEVKEYDDELKKRTVEELQDYRVVRPGQLVVNTMWLNYRGIGVSPHRGYVSPAYRAYYVSPSIYGVYLHYLMRSDLYLAGYSMYLQGIRPNSLQMKTIDFECLPILVPSSIKEQTAIATFLDTKTAQIDSIVTTINSQIDKLKELRKALINNVVTGKIKVVSEEGEV